MRECAGGRAGFLEQQALRSLAGGNVAAAVHRLGLCEEALLEECAASGYTPELCRRLGDVIGTRVRLHACMHGVHSCCGANASVELQRPLSVQCHAAGRCSHGPECHVCDKQLFRFRSEHACMGGVRGQHRKEAGCRGDIISEAHMNTRMHQKICQTKFS